MRDEAETTSQAAGALESREQLEAILRGVADAVLVEDRAGRVVYANEAAAAALAVASPLALLQGTLEDALAPFELLGENGARLLAGDLPGRAALDGHRPPGRRVRWRRLEGGAEGWWVVSVAPIPGPDDVPSFAVSVIRDITTELAGSLANARLAAIVASSGDAIIGKSLDAIVTSWNPAAERLYGYSADEIIGRPIATLAPPERQDEIPAIMERIRVGEALEPFETVRVRKDGSRVDVSLRISPVRDGSGTIVGASTIARDITEHRRAVEGLRLLAEAGDVLGGSLDYRTTLASVAELLVPRLADWCAVHIIDEAGTPYELALAHANPERLAWVRELQQRFKHDYEETSGLMRAIRSREPIVHREISDETLVAGARSPEHLAALRQLGFRSGLIVPMIARERAVGAIVVVFAESGRLYGDGDLALVGEIARRAALAVDNAVLFAEAQRAARTREDFLLTASHELRTPLTSVKAVAQIMERYLDRPELDRGRMGQMIARLRQEVERLEALTSDLLDAARIQRGRFALELEPSDLVALAGDVVDALEHTPERLPEHTLRIDAPAAVIAVCDPRRMRQTLVNLLTNALKYSPRGGEVRVRVVSDGADAVIQVSDTGIGIDPAEIANLYEPFERGAAVRQTIGGAGLGLYITRQIVESHGGTIGVESRPGAGSRFTVRLPAAVVEAP